MMYEYQVFTFDFILEIYFLSTPPPNSLSIVISAVVTQHPSALPDLIRNYIHT